MLGITGYNITIIFRKGYLKKDLIILVYKYFSTLCRVKVQTAFHHIYEVSHSFFRKSKMTTMKHIFVLTNDRLIIK